MKRLLWKTARIVLLSLLGIVVGLAAWLLALRLYHQHALAESIAIHTPNGIEEGMYVRIGGIEQWIQIRGQDRSNPVLLFLHGGPGGTLLPMTELFVPWEKAFTLVQWDQRGAGKTLETTGASVAATMSIDRMTRDGIEVSEFLRTHLHKDKIILLGHSWGSILGIYMIRQRPDLFYAWVGTGQVGNMPESLRIGYARLLEKARAKGDPKVVQALEWMTRLYDELGGAEKVYAFHSNFQGGDLDPFITGKLVMKIDGFWQITDSIAQYGKNVNWGIAPPPIPQAELDSGSHTCTWVSGWCYAIPSTSKHKEAAWELLRYLSTQRANEIYSESQRLTLAAQGRVFVPTQNANKKINEWLFEKYVYNNPRMDPKIGEAVKVFNNLLEGQPYRPVTPVGQLLWNQHISAMENAIFHKMTPQQACDSATMIVQRDLDRALSPPAGPVVNWNYFFALYGVLLVAVAMGVYYWDTSARMRGAMSSAMGPLGRKLAKGGGGIEGLQSSYFRSQWKGGWLCALPWIIGFIVFTGGPILFSIIISFCRYNILNPARFIGADNYVWAFVKDPLFWKALWNTVFMMIGIPIGMALSLGIALLLNLKVRGVAVWRTFFYLPSIVPAVASSILWIWILNPQAGFLNQALESFNQPLNWLYAHLTFLPAWLQFHVPTPNWLQSEHTSKPALILMGLWGAGGGMIIWLAGLKGISESYYEAAALDGASTWQQFVQITLPLLSPYIFFNLIMGLIGTFQIFTQAFIMTQGGPVDSTLFYAYHLFNNAFRYLQMGYAAAMAWVLFVIVFGLTIVQMKLSERWVHYEAD